MQIQVKNPASGLFIYEIEHVEGLILSTNSFKVWDIDNVCFVNAKGVFEDNRAFVVWKAPGSRKKLRNFVLDII